jgi:hypothetical protein
MTGFSVLPEWLNIPDTLKLDLIQVQEEKNVYANLLWYSITPGWTALLLISIGIYYCIVASNEIDFEGRKRLNEVGFLLIVLGVFNIGAYLLLVYYQRGKKTLYFNKATPVKTLLNPTNATLKSIF